VCRPSSFGKFLKISFNERGHIESGKIIDYLLEKVRHMTCTIIDHAYQYSSMLTNKYITLSIPFEESCRACQQE
jgi:hypothetical protein